MAACTCCYYTFEYPHRWAELGDLVDPPLSNEIRNILENNDRQLEDYLSTVGVACGPLSYVYIVESDTSTTTHSAGTAGAWGVAAGDLMVNMLFTYGNATIIDLGEEPEWTIWLSSLAPAAPHRAFMWTRIATLSGSDDAQTYTWNSPGVGAVALTVGIRRSGLGYWNQDWWSSGPDTSFVEPGFEVHRCCLVFVRSDDGSTVDGADLIYRSLASDVPDIGVIEVWAIDGVTSGTTTADIDVTALSGDIQWATWIDIFEV